jgi:hypothetical protein
VVTFTFTIVKVKYLQNSKQTATCAAICANMFLLGIYIPTSPLLGTFCLSQNPRNPHPLEALNLTSGLAPLLELKTVLFLCQNRFWSLTSRMCPGKSLVSSPKGNRPWSPQQMRKGQSSVSYILTRRMHYKRKVSSSH